MSQQTLISVVLPKFNQFIQELPTLSHLAECPDEKLRYLWSGLGYYARARNLREGAKYILNQHHGIFPTTKKDWLQVPGCGPYTASIIASICFDEPVAAVDGNVIRVTSRLLGLAQGVWEKSGLDQIQRHMDLCISPEHPGDFNQAMMDLGATVCKKQNPICGICPLQSICTAYEKKITELCPPVKPRKQSQEEILYALALVHKEQKKYLLLERTSGFLSKTIGFPLLAEKDGFSLEKIQGIAQKHNLDMKTFAQTFKHTITHHKITGHVVLMECPLDVDVLTELIPSPALSKNLWFSGSLLKENLSSSLDHKVEKLLSLSYH